MTTVTTNLLTAEQFAALPGPFDGPVELVKGELVEMNPPRPRHGEMCSNIDFALRLFLREHPLGRVTTNDSSILIERDPDTVRGVDVAFYSYERVPKGPLPAGLLDVTPDLVFEVLSPHDRWSELHVKIGEYFGAGVRAVCVLDDATRTLHAFFPDRPPHIFAADDELTLPEILAGFRVPVQTLLE